MQPVTAIKNHETSVRRFSFFEKSHLRCQDCFEFGLCFFQDKTLNKCAKNSGNSYGGTAVEWATFHSEIVKEYIHTVMPNIMFQGDVEIDKSLLWRRCKYHRRNPNVGIKVWDFWQYFQRN